VHAAQSVLAVPLVMRIHEGIVWSNRDRRTLLDKMLALHGIVDLAQPFYFVGDAYYASGKIINGLLAQNNHLVTRARSNAVAYRPFVARGPKRRGRPRIYDKKVALQSLFRDTPALQEMPSPVYGETDVTLRYHRCDLLWRPARRIVRFVAVIHPTRGKCLLMCTDLSLHAADIIRLYGLRRGGAGWNLDRRVGRNELHGQSWPPSLVIGSRRVLMRSPIQRAARASPIDPTSPGR
jgi:hypothetical protein